MHQRRRLVAAAVLACVIAVLALIVSGVGGDDPQPSGGEAEAEAAGPATSRGGSRAGRSATPCSGARCCPRWS
jgi:hypothetical protein